MLRGDGVRIDLTGSTAVAAKTRAMSATYQRLPDIPLSTFELTLPAGPNSTLLANGNLCGLTKVVKTVSKRVAVRRHGHVLRRNGHVVYRTEQIKQSAPTSVTAPSELVAQNGAPPISVNTPVTVAGCAKSKPAGTTKKKKKKNEARRGRSTERKGGRAPPRRRDDQPIVKNVRSAPEHKRRQHRIRPPGYPPGGERRPQPSHSAQTRRADGQIAWRTAESGTVRRIGGGSMSERTSAPMHSAVNSALLGLVIERPSYAYELALRFERTYDGALTLPSVSHIYTALASLRKRGLVEEAAYGGPRQRYQPTGKGLARHAVWLIGEVSEERRRERRLVSQLGPLGRTPERAIEVLDRYEQACLAEIAAAPHRAVRRPARPVLIALLIGEETRLSVAAKLRWAQYARAQLLALAERQPLAQESQPCEPYRS